MDAEVYPDPRVVSFVTQNFLPARIHVRENKAEWERYSQRYGVQWTPAVLVVDPSGTERHRIEGFLPVEDFLAQLSL
ncbi:MAG TPA: thioredoxin family protein, partial [Myxococcales bacterium]